MPIVQISRIQHRRGKKTDLPQLAAGELGWVVDEQRLYIGNGTVSDGAPAVGNTEIVTSGSSAFTSALSHTYKGYLGDSTPVTDGDLAVDKLLKEKILNLTPDIPIISEETVNLDKKNVYKNLLPSCSPRSPFSRVICFSALFFLDSSNSIFRALIKFSIIE